MKFSTYTGKLLITLSLIVGFCSLAVADTAIKKNDDLFSEEAADKKNLYSQGQSRLGTSNTPPSLTGSWAVTLSNTTTKMLTPALYSFLDNGILIQSENPLIDPMLGHLAFSNAHGSWQYNPKDKSYSIRYLKLAFQADALYRSHEVTTGKLSFDETGKLLGHIKVGDIKSDFLGHRITVK